VSVVSESQKGQEDAMQINTHGVFIFIMLQINWADQRV
jgi:hypothetical protein